MEKIMMWTIQNNCVDEDITKTHVQGHNVFMQALTGKQLVLLLQ